MSLKDDLLEELHVGDTVTLLYCQSNHVTGKILRLTPNLIQLETSEGRPRIELDSINSYDPDSAPPSPPDPAPVSPISATQPSSLSEEEHILKAMEECRVPSLEEVADWNGIRAEAKASENRDARGTVAGILDVLSYASRQHDSSAQDKIRDAKARALQGIKRCPQASALLHRLLGSICLTQSDFSGAEQYYSDADWYKGAAYAAKWGNHPQALGSYLEQYLLREEVWERDLIHQYVDLAVGNRDISTLCVCLRQAVAPSEARLRSLIDCSVYLAHRGGFSIRWTTPDSLYAPDNLRAILASFPAEWQTDSSQENPVELVPTPVRQNASFRVGTIKRFDPNCYGFIQEENGADCYFHVHQIRNEDIDLRQALYCGEWRNLEVRYTYGVGRKSRSADAIELTERGRSTAKERLAKYRSDASAPLQERLQGSIEHYNQRNAWGAIRSGGESYGFYLSAVEDPFLRAYLDHSFEFTEDKEVKVSFVCGFSSAGKKVAKQIAAAEPFPDKDRQMWLRYHYLTAEEAQAWQGRQEGLDEEDELVRLDPDEDPYPNLDYEALAPWQEAPAPVRATAPPPPAPADSATPEPAPPAEDDRCYHLAHQAQAHGSLKQAEAYYLQALQQGVRTESCIAELISVYLRQEGRVKDAFSALDQYGSALPEEKRMNLVLQVCQKGKDRETRFRLIQELERAIEMTTKISARFHYLMLRGNALRQLSQYGAALRVYQQWRDLYNSELQAMGSRVMIQYSSRLNTIKRGEAYCYYFLGDLEQARSLAQELRRVNATDETALAILDGTLSEEAMLDDDPGLGPPPEDDDEPGNSPLNEYIHDRIRDLDVGNISKSRHIKDGRFEGTPEDAKNDVDAIRSRLSGSAPKTKSDLLLSAAKIISQVWERHPESESTLNRLGLRKSTIQLYAGRSLALYGNYLVTTSVAVMTAANSAQMDAARFLYLEALTLLLSKEQEQDRRNAFVYYIFSYFYGQEEMQARVRESGRISNPSIQQGLALLSSAQNAPLSGDEFTFGMLQLLTAIQHRGRLGSDLEHALFESRYQEDFRTQFRQMGIPFAGPGFIGFVTELRTASNQIKEREQQFEAALSACSEQPLGGLAQQERLAALRGEDWSFWMSATDLERLKKTLQLLERLNQSGDVREFERRDDLLSTVITQLVQLCAEIDTCPTRVSYSILRPALLRVREMLAMERGKLYELAPHLTLSQSEEIQPYHDGDRSDMVYVHLELENGVGLQMADNIQLQVTCPPGVSLFNPSEARLPGIRGGSTEELSLRFLIDDSVQEQGSFAVTVEGAYSYKRDAQNIAEGQIEPAEFAIVLRKSAEPIPNIFAGLDHSEMTEDSMFLGRDDIINSMVGMMCLPTGRFNYGHGLVLFGQTRAGKSSILFHLKKRVRQRYGDRVFLVNLGNIDEIANTGNLFTNLLYTIAGELEMLPHALLGALEELLGCPLYVYRERLLDEPQNAEALFSSLMRKLDRLLEEPEDGQPMMLLLLIDEFSCVHEEMKKGTLPPRFMFFWKALLENHALFTVVAGQDDMPQFIEENQNAFMAMQLRKVTYLDESAAKRLLSEPIQLPNGESRYIDSALDEMYRLTAGSAFLILLLSAALVDYLNKRGADRVTKAVIDGFLRERVFCSNSCLTNVTFEAQIQDRSDKTLEDENKVILTAIARASRQGGRAEYASIQKSCPQIEASRLMQLLDRLVERDVLIREVEQSSRFYRIEVELLARWLLYQNGERD